MALTAVETSSAYITKANITLLLPYVFFYSLELIRFNNTILHNIACTVTLFTWDPIVSQLQAPQDNLHPFHKKIPYNNSLKGIFTTSDHSFGPLGELISSSSHRLPDNLWEPVNQGIPWPK